MSITARSLPRDGRERVLDAAEALFAAESLFSVTLTDIAAKAGISGAELAAVFSSKDLLVEQVLDLRHAEWMTRLAAAVAEYSAPEDRLIAIFTFLESWFAEETFHRCAFITSYGELGPSTGWVDVMIRRHKTAFDTFVRDLAYDAALPQTIASSIALLADGAQVAAAATGNIAAARDARSSAALLIALYHADPVDAAFL